jgi:protein gp37
MFKSITSTWNVYKGCSFECSYCYARKAALTRFKHVERYLDGFTPKLIEKELDRRFKPGEFIFVAFMGDISFATREDASLILSRIRLFPKTWFLFCSKNPGVYEKWNVEFPPHLYLGTTLETNRDYRLTKAPPPLLRLKDLVKIPWPRKFVSIEPIMDFDLEIFVSWLHWLKPAIIEVGADNYHNHLQEPSGSKVASLLEHLRDICPTVVEKEGLERLGIKP